MEVTVKALTPTQIQIVEAAVRVFSQKGIKGATTREIAKEAGVNETTLFRNFNGKDALVAAVISRIATDMGESLNPFPHPWTHRLYEDLLHYGRVFQQALFKNASFLRVLVGESAHNPEALKKVLQSSNLVFSNHLHAYLDEARMSGLIRPGLDSVKMANILTGMILADVIRRGIREVEDEPEVYLQDCLDIFIRGIEAR